MFVSHHDCGQKTLEPRVLVKPTEDLGMQFDRTQLVMSYLWRTSERLYLAKHSRLPGSLRTVRLRKKRGRVIAKWFRSKYVALY